MKNFKTFAVLTVIGLALAGQSVSAQDAAKRPTTLPLPTPAVKVETPQSDKDKAGASGLPDPIKKLKDDFKQSHQTYLDEQKALLNKAKGGSKEDQEVLRAKIKENRQEFLEKQKAVQEEIRKQMADLKDKLKDHREVIDEAKEKAKETAKEKVKGRKGGDN
jgi:hypothetical protein